MSDLEGLTLPELLDQLHDLSVAPAVPYTPETMGWLVSGVILLVLLGAAIMVAYRRRRRNAYRRIALSELTAIEARLGIPSDRDQALAELATLVRRTALAAFPREQVAHLYGSDWKVFLNRTASDVPEQGLDGLLLAPYRPVDIEPTSALQAARHWIRHHHA